VNQALSGIKVLDLSERIAGPYACKLLADFGAEVLKVEPPTGDPSRRMGPFPNDVPHLEKSGLFLWLNLNKKSITIDVFTHTGRQILDRLIADTDVLVSSYSPREFEELGLAAEQLSSLNPRIVVAAITPWGLTGPYRDYAASEITLDAWGHAMSAFGTSDREPLTVGGSVRQYFSGQVAAFAALGATMTAKVTGRGQTLDLSMMEAQLGNVDRRSFYILRYQYLHEVLARDERGILSANLLMGYHPCKDGWISGGANPATFQRFAHLLGHDEWLEDARFQPIVEKFRDPTIQAELEVEFILWLGERTRAEVIEVARANGFQFFPVNEISDVLSDRHLIARDFWLDVEHPLAGKLKYPGAPFKMAAGGYEQHSPAPLLGQHNEAVLHGQLRFEQEDLPHLSAEGVLSPGRRSARAPGPPPVYSTGTTTAGGIAKLPLEGIRVLDMTVVWAGPYGTMLLGDLGAEIIRVESLQFFPGSTRGHFVRPKKEDVATMGYFQSAYPDKDPGERPWNRWAGFNLISRNKLSVTADLARPEGIEIFKKLVAVSDIVVDNLSFGAIDRMGLGYEELKKINPRIIQISMPLFGNTGPYKELRGIGSAVDAFSGFLAMRGYRDGDVTMTQPIFYMDATSGAGSAFAALCALRYREQHGTGQFIDFSQCENMMHQAGEYVLDWDMNHRNPQPLGNRDGWGAVQGCYPCQAENSWLVITLRDDADWRSFCDVIGNPDWCSDQRYETTISRLHHHDALDESIASWTSTVEAEKAMHQLQAAGVPAAKVTNEAEIVEDRHLKERGFFVRMTHPDCGTHLYPGHLWKSSAGPLRFSRAAPTLGEDNEYVYKQLLGYSEGEYARLVAEKHAGTAYVEGLTTGVNRPRNT
jgi:crotonobetainyl-CoA:carnitine CoA-transferase CaiB-like acyl-CoA transferase